MALEFVSGFVVSSLLQELVDRIKASAADTISLAYSTDVEEELKNLEASYVKALSMLDKVDGWDLITSKLHRDWVADVRRACYETEDFTEHLKLEILKKMGDASFMRSYWTKWGASRKLRDLQNNLDHLSNTADRFVNGNHRLNETRQNPVFKTEPVTLVENQSFRRKRDKENIVQNLLSSSSSSSRVVVIAGMFGIGKTTVAHVVKNDPRIQCHFDHKLWVSLSGNFDLEKVLNSMVLELQLEQIQEVGLRLSPAFSDQLSVRMFRGLCKGRRVLIVLDDLCNFAKPQDWEDFQSLLLDPSCMFGVIITTRNPRVATTIASLTTFPTVSHYLQKMSVEDCGSLILHKAALINQSNSKRKHCGRNALEVCTAEMAENFCKGLPLVANILGHHLSSNTKPEGRCPIMLPKDLWDLPEFREQIFPSFRLNYSDLSIFLKNCFPYFSLFPDDYNFKKDELIQLWLAEGFIKSQVAAAQSSEYQGLEELGSYHFDEVLSRSILQIYHPFDKDPQIYKMHEFIRRYAQFVGTDMFVHLSEQFISACSSNVLSSFHEQTLVSPFSTDVNHTFASINRTTWCRNARHLSLLSPSISPLIWKAIEKCEGLRTFISLHEHTHIGQISHTLFLKLQSLRVLDLSGTDISELPESVGKLKQLRFLDVSETDIEELPASTGDLYGLQFLKINQCPLLLQLPKNIKNLVHLLHLEVDMKGLASMPPNIGNLRNLRTLQAFIVWRKDGYRLSELKNMKYLQGSICLTNLENVKDDVEAKEAMLSEKPFLKRVELEWNRFSTDESLAEKILTGLEPHENLEELQMTGYDSANFPNWFSSSDCKLTSIYLLRCYRICILPPLGKLKYLKALHIEEIHKVKNIDGQFFGGGEEVGFPSLESLKIQDMMSLEKWEGLQHFQMPGLRDLVIAECPNLISLPSLNLLRSLVNLEISSCPALQALPEQGLPSSLEALVVVRSDVLKQRCLPEQGADWEKIKPVPKVVIDFVRVSTTQ